MLAALPKFVANRAWRLPTVRAHPLRWLAARPDDVIVLRREVLQSGPAAPAGLSDSLRDWRRRVRGRRVPAIVARALIVTGAIAAIAVVAHRAWDLPWLAVAAIAVASFLVAGAWSLSRPLPLEEIARLLDAQLGFDEQLATALALDRRPPLNQGLRGILAQRAAALATPRTGDRVAVAGRRRELWLGAAVIAALALALFVPGRGSGHKLASSVPSGTVLPRPAAPATPAGAAPHLHLRQAPTGTTASHTGTTPAKNGATVHNNSKPGTSKGVQPGTQAAAPWLHQHVAAEAGAKGRAVAPASGLKPGSGTGANTGKAATTQTTKPGKADHPPIGTIAAPGQDRHGNPAVGAATRESTSTAGKSPKGAVKSPYGGGNGKLQQQKAGLVVGKNVGGTGGFGNGSAGTGKAGNAGQSAGSQAASAKSGFQLTAGSGTRTAPGARNSAPNSKSGSRTANSDQSGAGVTAYVPPDGAAVPAEDRALVRAAHPLPATGAHSKP
jgi:hypothetical protein